MNNQSTYNKTYYEKHKTRIPCDYCGRCLTTIELKGGINSRHYKHFCRGNENRIYKDRKQGNFKKVIKNEPIKSEIEIKREKKQEFRKMLQSLIYSKKMDIDEIYKLYAKEIEEYKYI